MIAITTPEDIIPVQFIRTSMFFLITTIKLSMFTPEETDNDALSSFHSISQPWEYELLQFVNIFDAEKLVQILTSEEELLIGTDGGAMDHVGSGSFGWVVATTDTILAENGGPIFGRKPDSFRAETYGVLSVYTFLRLFATYCEIQITCKSRLISDSESFLTRLETTLTTTRPPRYYLAAAMDVEMQILEEFKTWPALPKKTHVKSHQG